ncbi:MAG: orotate phosphoribosyltransferase [Dichotomicrobium sp.]
MTEDDILAVFKETGALRTGHFILTSGLHSDTYIQCAQVLQYPWHAERLCAALAEKLGEVRADIDMVVSPAMGGVIVGYEMGRQLGVPAVFVERSEGAFALRRDFRIPRGTRCLMVEDVVTTGLSSRECVAAAQAEGGEVVAACCLVDRSGGRADLGLPLIPLLQLDVATYPPDDLPSHLRDTIPVKPGSRNAGAA